MKMLQNNLLEPIITKAELDCAVDRIFGYYNW